MLSFIFGGHTESDYTENVYFVGKLINSCKETNDFKITLGLIVFIWKI